MKPHIVKRGRSWICGEKVVPRPPWYSTVENSYMERSPWLAYCGWMRYFGAGKQ